MPVVFIKKVGDSDIGLWEITETAEDLQKDITMDDESNQQLLKINHEGRKKHWLAYRLLLKTMLGFDYVLKYSESGKPFIADFEGYISVSHSGKYAAVITGKRPVGIDVEKISPRIIKVVERFMSNEEIASVKETEKPDKFYVYWSAKEALHKLYGDQIFEFNKELTIKDFIFAENGIVEVHIENEKYCEDKVLNYQRINEYILAWL